MSNARFVAGGAKRLRLLIALMLLLSPLTHAETLAEPAYDEEGPAASSPATSRGPEYPPAEQFELRSLRQPLLHLEVTSPFGERLNPVMRRKVFHKGVDYGAPTGTPVYAAQSGTVEAVGLQNHAGIYVRLRHSQQVETIYAHLHRIMPGLRRGSMLHVGDILGFVGSSGFTTGPHLHYEVLLGGQPVNPDLCWPAFKLVSRREH